MTQPTAIDIFNDALQIDSDQERDMFLEQACSDSESIRQHVRKLLAAHFRAGDFLQGSDSGMAHTEAIGVRSNGRVSPLIGSQIGPYKIREQIGEGGMGAVYVAEQSKPVKRKVALKLIRTGLASSDVIGRFEAERQALAMMNHPNIARVLDGGTTDSGQPYFAMELVQGLPITEYCDQRKLSNEERLNLFLDACGAVQHAHQRGIIHRDLKPSNILVSEIDDKAVVKVIDFGVAKAVNQKLTDQTVYTHFAQMVGTPLYMSPEQAGLGVLDVDTRSDVFSLGVLLYELLTGNTPFDRATLNSVGYDEMRRMIREEEPRRPSVLLGTLAAEVASTVSERRRSDPRRLATAIRGELDWIVMKSLEKDRSRRYESASAMAADVERFLNDEPVEACPPNFGYRIGKVVRRNRGLMATGAAVFIALLIGTGAATWQAVLADAAAEQAEKERVEAERNMKAAMDAMEKLLANVSNPKLANVPGLQEMWADILKDSIAFYERFKADSGSSPDVDFRAAKVFLRFGHLMTVARPDTEDVVLNYERGLELAQGIVLQEPKRTDFRDLLAKLHLACADYYWMPDPLATPEYDQKTMRHFSAAQQQYAQLVLENPGEKDFSAYQGIVFWRMAEFLHRRAPSDPRIESFLTRASELGYEESYHAKAVRAHRNNDPKLATTYWRKAIADHRSGKTVDPILREIQTSQFSSWWLRDAAIGIADEYPDEAESVWQEGINASYEELREFPSSRMLWKVFDETSRAYSRHILKTHDLRTALSKVDELVQSSPAFHVLRAKILDQWRDRKEQLRLLNDSIRDHPSQVDYYRVRSEVFENQGEWQSAFEDLNHVLELDKYHQYAYRRRGTVQFELGNYQHAIDDYTTWLNARGGVDSHKQLKRRAAAYFKLGKYEEALADLNREFDQFPDYLTALTWIPPEKIAACPDERFREGMLQLASRVVQLNDESVASLIARARLLLALGDAQRAKSDLQAAATKSPTDPKSLNQIAWQLVTVPEVDALLVGLSVSFAEKAVSLKPETSIYWNTLGVAQYRAGNYESAITSCQRSLELDKNESIVPNNAFILAMSCWRLGNQQEARTWYEKAVARLTGRDDQLRLQSEAAELLGIGEASASIRPARSASK